MEKFVAEKNIGTELPKLPNFIVDHNGNKHGTKAYLPKQFSDTEASQIAIALSPITAEGFMRSDPNDPALYEDVYHHIKACDRLLIAENNGGIEAFAAISLRGNPEIGKIYHIEGVISKEELSGSKIAYELLAAHIFAVRPDFIAFHTQSKRMQKLGEKLADFDFVSAYKIGSLIDTVDQQGIVDVGRYGGKCLYGDIKRFSHQAIAEIDYLHGDALICAGRVKPEILTISPEERSERYQRDKDYVNGKIDLRYHGCW